MNDRQISNSRLVDAPIEAVWAAWTDPTKVARWWGPDGFRSEVEEMDVRPGGRFRLTMVGPDGRRYPNELRYRDVERPHRITWDHDTGMPNDPNTFQSEVRFEAVGSRTRVTLTATLQTAERREFVVKHHNAIEGGKQTLGRFAGEVEAVADGLVVSRLLRAPRERVWTAFTDPAQLGQWWGPKGFEIVVHRAAMEPGGVFLYSMDPPGGGDRWWGRMAFRELSPTDRLAWINSFSDPDGGVTRAPFLPDFPAEVHILVTLDEVEGGTHLTLRARPINADAAGIAAFDGLRPSMDQGYGGTLDQLEAHLAG